MCTYGSLRAQSRQPLRATCAWGSTPEPKSARQQRHRAGLVTYNSNILNRLWVCFGVARPPIEASRQSERLCRRWSRACVSLAHLEASASAWSRERDRALVGRTAALQQLALEDKRRFEAIRTSLSNARASALKAESWRVAACRSAMPFPGLEARSLDVRSDRPQRTRTRITRHASIEDRHDGSCQVSARTHGVAVGCLLR